MVPVEAAIVFVLQTDTAMAHFSWGADVYILSERALYCWIPIRSTYTPVEIDVSRMHRLNPEAVTAVVQIRWILAWPPWLDVAPCETTQTGGELKLPDTNC